MTVGTFPLLKPSPVVVHVDANFVAQPNHIYVVHNSAGAVTGELPDNPADGDTVTIGMTGTGPLTIIPSLAGTSSVKPLKGPADPTGVIAEIEGSQAQYIYRIADDTWYAQDTYGGGDVTNAGANYIGNAPNFAGLGTLNPATAGDTASTAEGIVYTWTGTVWTRGPSQRTDGSGADGTYALQTDLPGISDPRVGDTAVLDDGSTYIYNGVSWQQTGSGGSSVEEVGEGDTLPADDSTWELFRLSGHASLPDALYSYDTTASAWFQT